jgi:hypothetical protein
VRRAALPLCLAFVVALTGCRPTPAPLTNTFDSPEALAREVLARLARRDQGGLRELALTRTEFADHVWPELPASRPERNTPLSFVWGRLEQQSALSLAGTVSRLGGTAYVLQDVRFEGETTDYGSFSVRRQSVLVVRTPAGAVEQIKVFGAMLTQGGRHKIFSFVVD